MSDVTTHERPGVYSAYDASSVVDSTVGNKRVAIVAARGGGEGGEVYELTRYEQAAAQFGAEDRLTRLVQLLFLNGAAAVVALPVAGEEGYAKAFETVAQREDIGVVLCDSTLTSVQQALRDSVENASQSRYERVGVVCGGAKESVSELVARAQSINHARMVLVAPCESEESGATAAAAVAGAIAATSDPAVPLGGAELRGVTKLNARYNENELDQLIQGGVTVLESVGGVVSVIRGVTTKTKSGDAVDNTWRELTTILIVDDVIPAIRNSLRAKFRRAKNTAQSRGAIRSQVILELENKLSAEIITGYDDVTVTAKEDDPTVCLVDFSFMVTHGINQIWLTAHITV